MSNLRVRRSAFKTLGQSDLAVYAGNVFDRMAALPEYQVFASAITTLGEKVNYYKNALTVAASGGNDRIAIKNAAKAAVLNALENIARLLESYPNDEATFITNTSMEVNDSSVTRNPALEVPRPEKLEARSTGVPGEAEITFLLVAPKLVRQNVIEYSDDEGATWKPVRFSTTGKVKVKNLPSRINLRIRVKSLGSFQRESNWTETQVSVL